jgi:alkanesulfonate monooxygenase SsuD/methylene tetrahydromethanopterin reductase-like flavin-dependent oxidoreductase (luciferase family)
MKLAGRRGSRRGFATATFVDEVKQLRAHLADAGRDPASFPIGKRVYIAVDRDRARAAKRLAEWFGAFYGKPGPADEISAFGDVDACVEGLHAIIAGGARCPPAQSGVR